MIDGDYARLGEADLDAVFAIELAVHTHPWTRGNFVDSLTAGYELHGLRDAAGTLHAFVMSMQVIDEMHILDIAVSTTSQRRGMALCLLNHVREHALSRDIQSILLEVRVSNERALQVYRRYGFAEIGRRKAYYPLDEQRREDAIVMRLEL